VKRLVLPVCAAAAALSVAGSAAGGPQTTNVPAIFTVKVVIRDKAIAMSPNHAVRGSTITFVLTNRGKKTHTFVIGDVKRGTGFGQGFKQTLKPNQQFTKVMFLDYRGVMRFYTRTGSAVVARGAFNIK
jgi:hypothetical protein